MMHRPSWLRPVPPFALLTAVGAIIFACSERNKEPIGPRFEVGAFGGWDLNQDNAPSPSPFTLTITSTDGYQGLWTFPTSFKVGTGLINPFLRVQNNGSEEGFNTSNGAPYDDKSGTSALPLNHVPIVKQGGVAYREFILDANENNAPGQGNWRLSIDVFDVWVCNDNGADQYTTFTQFENNPTNCKRVYDLGGHVGFASDALTSGSGQTLDYDILIPEEAFTDSFPTSESTCPYQGVLAPACGYWLIVRTRMGDFGTDANGHSWAADATFEEISTVQRPVPPRLTLVKQVTNNDGGAATADQWTLSATGTSGGFSGTPSPGGGATGSVGPGDVDIGVQYTLSETGGPTTGYSSTGVWICSGGGTFVAPDKITLAEGQNATCTIVNDDVAPTLTLEKQVINDDGGTAFADEWTLHATGSGGFDGTPAPADALIGSVGPHDVTGGVQYTLSETGGPATGYSTTGVWSCAGGGTFESPDKITLAVGESATCRIVNDDVAAQLTLEKEVVNDDGGTAFADDWTLLATGSSASFSGTPTPADALIGSVGPKNVTGGVQYTLSESGGPASGYSTTGTWNCSGGGTFVSPDKITLAVGETATCRIVNDDVAPTLTLEKEVVNDDGGTAFADDWTLLATGSSASFSGTPAPADALIGSVGPKNVTGGVQYTLSETAGPASGYSTTGTWSCTGGGTFVSPDKITLAVGETATCRIVNNDVAAQLTLEKEVVNDNGGTAFADEWTLHATGTGGFSGVPAPADVLIGSVGPNDVMGGVQYTLSETGGPASGYSSTGVWSCTGGGTFVSPDKVTLAVGEKVSCRIVNDDVAPQLTLEKEVVNDDGGTAFADEWTLHATGTGGFSGVPAPADVLIGSVGPTDVTGGVQYTLSETGGPASGYSSTGVWACTGGGTFDSPDKITLAVGEKVTCRIVNDDVAAQLTLEKEVVNDNGGTAFADEWTLAATGTGGFSGVPAPADVLIGSVGPSDVTAGVQYTLSETGGPASGYSSTGAWVCTGGGTFVSPNKITLAVGETATCRIVNDDVAPTLTLEKEVVNDDGGTAFADDWTLLATGSSASFSGTPAPADVLIGSVGPKNVTGGVQYTLSETGGPASGYSTTGVWSCSGGGTFVSPDKITLEVGETATCRIVNDDVAPTLTLEKEVVNDDGGTAFADDWMLLATGSSASFSGTPAPADVLIGSVGPKNVTGGVQYTLSETGGPASGYSTTGTWSCTGGGNFVSPDKITLAVGEKVTCRIENDDQPGKIIIKKITKPIGASTSFQFQTTGTGYAGFSLTGGTENSQTLSAGLYSAMELVPLGWVLTGIGGSTDPSTPNNCTVTGSGGSTGVGELNTQTVTISLKNGDIVTCVFENTGQGVTRTQGFWATHSQLASIAWFGGTAFGHTFPGVAGVSGIGDMLICGRELDGLGKVMGSFWSAIPKKSDGTKRSSLDQARMQLLQQLIAAELNASAFGSAPSSGSFLQWETALCGTNTDAIKTAQQQAASFNSAGDNSTFTPGTSADSKSARSVADIPFWDIIKP